MGQALPHRMEGESEIEIPLLCDAEHFGETFTPELRAEIDAQAESSAKAE